MEQFPASSYESQQPAASLPGEAASLAYPPKFHKQEQPANVWMKSILSLGVYLILGYYFFHSFEILLIITGIVVFHELGHFAAMKVFKYRDLGIFFIPLLGAYVSGTKREVSQKQSAIILLAGPLPGIVLGVILFLVNEQGEGMYFLDVSLSRIAQLMVILNLINLIPIYPLDGGQILNRVFLDEEGWMGKIFVFLSAIFMAWFAWKSGMIVLYILPAMMLLRLKTDRRFDAVEKKIEEEGINMDVSYEELPDRDYWRVRNILITDYSGFRDVYPAPPFEFHPKEERIMSVIQSLLHRHLIQDVSILGKIFILLIWTAAFAVPWLIDMDILSFFRRFGF